MLGVSWDHDPIAAAAAALLPRGPNSPQSVQMPMEIVRALRPNFFKHVRSVSCDLKLVLLNHKYQYCVLMRLKA